VSVHVTVYLPLLVPVAAMLAARPLADHLPPWLATWLLTIAAVVLAAASTAALGLLALTGLAQIPPLAEFAHLSVRVVRDGDPTQTPVAAAAALMLTAVTIAASRMVWRRARTLAIAAREAACLPGPGQLVVLDDPAAEAFAVPGRPGRIVVSAGMLAALTPTQQEALLAHERAHLRYHHYLFIAAAQLAATANPLLRPAATAVTYTVERWADEHAATACGDRRHVATTIGKAALADSSAGARAPGKPAALGIGGTWRRRGPLAGAGPLPRRVAALLAAPPTTRAVPLCLAAALLVITGACTLESANDLHTLLALAHHSR
jgi:hypothetical protein